MKTKISILTFYFFFLPRISFCQNEDVVLKITDTSSFELIQEGKDTIYRKTEMFYEFNQFNNDDKKYLIKTKKTVIYHGGDNNDPICDISIIDVSKPQINLYEFSKECNEIKVDIDERTFQTILYGCCAAPNELKVFDFNDRLIIEGDYKIYRGLVNDKLNIYLSFQSVYEDQSIGYLHIVINGTIRFKVKLEGVTIKKIKDGGDEELCPILDPNFRFSKNVFIYSDYELDIKNVKTIDDLNFDIQLDFRCGDLKKVKIPIIKGKPFGKDLPVQRMYIMK